MPLSQIMGSLRSAWKAWSWFWFRPVTASGLGIMRILMGVMLVMTSFDLISDLALLVGPDGVYSAGAAAKGTRMGRWTWFDHVESMDVVYLIHAVNIVVNLLFLVGFRSRTMGVLSVVFHAALYQRNGWFMNGGDRLVREFTLYMCVVPCGAAHSVDAWLSRRRAARRGEGPSSPLIPILAHRLIQVQLCVMYTISGLDKLATGSWKNGNALYYALSSENYQRSPALVEPLLTTQFGQWVLEVASYTTLVWEIGFPLFILWRPTRVLALVVGAMIHFGIFASMMVAYFSAASVWAYLSFGPYDWAERIRDWRVKRRQGGLVGASSGEE